MSQNLSTDPQDLPEMPAPRVREFTAHSIPGGLVLLGCILSVLLGGGATNTGSFYH